MAMKGRNMMGGRNPRRKKAIDEAVGEAMEGNGRNSSPRPRLRPSRGGAPASSPRPRLRPESMEEDGGAVERGNRAAMREAFDQETLAGGMKKGGKVKKMAKGGKVRGCGMARGGAVRPCKMVKMKGS